MLPAALSTKTPDGDLAELSDEMAISAVMLAELSAGPHEVRRSGERDLYGEHEERARRMETHQRAENDSDPLAGSPCGP
nr:hypothetical protein [Frankia sp. R43]